jgi:hypothetical protein
MPRTWGYVIIAAAIVIGTAALLLPVPESVEIEQPAVPKAGTPSRPLLPPGAGAPRARMKPSVPAPGHATKPPVRPVPMQDTTKTRQLIQPRKPAG